MNGDDFPYRDEDFSENENKKLARMIRWSYHNLSKKINENTEAIEEEKIRISKCEDFIEERQMEINNRKKRRRLYLKMAGLVGGLVSAVIGFLKWSGIK